jgi:hypothetical protein
MSKSALFAALLVPAFLLTAAIAEPAIAQEKKAAKKAEKAAGKASIKNLVSDDKARAYLVTYKPGEERAVEAGHRVVRALKGGTLERTMADGKKEKVAWKEGEVRINKPAKGYNVKNVGKTEVQLYVVEQK